MALADIDDITDINDVKDLGDNVVGFLSQIGWTGDGIADLGNLFTPTKKVPMEEIFVNADTNGGNPVFSFSFLHIKIPHRESVMKQIELYLNQ